MNKGHFWIGLVVAFLTIDVICGAVLVFFAHSSPSLGIEKDYQEKAAAWEETARQRAVNERLGWLVDLSIGAPEGALSEAAIEVVVRDADGSEIEGATVQMETYHMARSNDRFTPTLKADGGGAHQGTMRILREGWWQFDFVVTRGGDRFTAEDRRYVEGPRRR